MQKYYWLIPRANVEYYIKACDICLAWKVVKHKLYGNRQSIAVLTHQKKDLSMDFISRLLISTIWKDKFYNSILMIVNQLIKMVYYKPVKVIINTPALVEGIIIGIVEHHGLPNSIVTAWNLLFTSKFWLSLYYFFDIKQKLSTAFYLQTNSQIEKQNNTIETDF